MSLPESRRHRRERWAKAKTLREEEQVGRVRLMGDLEAEEKSQRYLLQKKLESLAVKLAQLVVGNEVRDKERGLEAEAAAIGARAWQFGGLNGMQQLHDMAVDICEREHQNRPCIDYVSVWWDGVGSWRNPRLSTKGM